MFNLIHKNYKLSSIVSCEDTFGISQYFECRNCYVVPYVLTSASLEYIYRMSEFVLDLKIDRDINEKYTHLYRSVRQKIIISLFR